MALYILIAFIVIPLIEIALFIEVGDWIGLWPTLAAIVLTALAGTTMLRIQGLATLTRARAEMDRGELPARELFDAFCLGIAGVLLLVPGFFTDAVGLLLFIPPFRTWLRRILGRNITVHTVTRSGQGPHRHARDGDQTIDADYVDVTNDSARQKEETSPRALTDEQDSGPSKRKGGSKWVQ